MNGTVKFFNAMKGFGFISAEDGKEYFVHQSALGEGVNLNENDPVSFDVEQGDRGPKAVNVKVGAAEEAAPAEESTEEAPAEEATEEEAPAEEASEEETKEE
jgi:CspA family cold shock protein